MKRANGIICGILIFLSTFGTGAVTSPAKADELFVVIGVEPVTPDIVAGAVYQSQDDQAEFIYVPEGVRIALLSEDGQRYLIPGRNAVLAERQSLSEFEIERIESPNPGFLNRLFGIGLPTEFVAATRRFDEEDLKINPGSVSDLSTIFVDLLQEARETPTFCLFSDTVTMRRSDDAGAIPLTLTLDGTEHSAAWKHGEKDLSLSGLSLPANRVLDASLKKGLSERALNIRRLSANALEKGLFATSVALARNDCTIQAVLLSNAIKR